MEDKDILNLIFEFGQLRRIKHEGWRLVGVENPDSVAEHSLRAAQIGFLLAKMEKYENPYEVCTMVVFHDIGECRIGDIHKVALRYLEADEERVVREQTENLEDIGKDILKLWQEFEAKTTTAGIIAKDADRLEQAVMAKEYIERGHASAKDWIINVSRLLKTKSAKKLLKLLETTDSTDWWEGLKKLIMEDK
jgi:putative hydrolases of HD superfamily